MLVASRCWKTQCCLRALDPPPSSHIRPFLIVDDDRRPLLRAALAAQPRAHRRQVERAITESQAARVQPRGMAAMAAEAPKQPPGAHRVPERPDLAFPVPDHANKIGTTTRRSRVPEIAASACGPLAGRAPRCGSWEFTRPPCPLPAPAAAAPPPGDKPGDKPGDNPANAPHTERFPELL